MLSMVQSPMGLRGGVLAVDPGALVDRDIIGAALHGTQQVVVQLWDMNSLMNNQMILYSCVWMNIPKGAADDAVLL